MNISDLNFLQQLASIQVIKTTEVKFCCHAHLGRAYLQCARPSHVHPNCACHTMHAHMISVKSAIKQKNTSINMLTNAVLKGQELNIGWAKSGMIR
jgi:hypothetical protein